MKLKSARIHANVTPVTVNLHLRFGDTSRLRIVDVKTRSVVGLSAPRQDFDELLKRPESNQCGIYILYNISTRQAYIGEGECLCKRLPGHHNESFWREIIFFTTKSDELTKAHARYLEGRLICSAREAGRYHVLNTQSSGAKLPEGDQADMESHLFWLRQLLPVLGCDLFSAGTTESELQMKPATARLDLGSFWREIGSLLTTDCVRISKDGEAAKLFLNPKTLLSALNEANHAFNRTLTQRELRNKLSIDAGWIDGKHRQRFNGKPTAACWCFRIAEEHPVHSTLSQFPPDAWLK